jgi:hypothetical protein
MLVAAYSASGELLWHIERDDEWPDETYANSAVMPTRS